MDEENAGREPGPAGPAAEPAAGPAPAPAPSEAARLAPPLPDAAPRPGSRVSEPRGPLYRDCGGYRLRMEPKDLAKLRELPGSKEKTDEELGEQFFDGQAERLTRALAEDVPPPADVRVVVDPYSRQAFLAVGKTIRGIVSF